MYFFLLIIESPKGQSLVHSYSAFALKTYMMLTFLKAHNFASGTKKCD